MFDSSPWHIAAFHVFHRLPAPRHPPLALSSLNYMNTLQLRLLYNFQKAKKTFSQLSRNISLYRQPVIDLRKFITSDKSSILLRKEVIQPHVPVRLPCYDLVPVTCLTLNSSLLAVRIPSLGTADFHDLTGGVYKTRERIHRGALIRDY